MTDPNKFLTGGGGKSASFGAVGTTITGRVAAEPEVQQQTDMKTGAPLFWDNGDKREQLVVALQTELRDDEDDDGIRKLYVKGSKKPESKSLHAAVAGAVIAAKAKGLEVGGTLTVTYTGDGVSSTKGFDPPKQYSATYVPASAEFLTGGQPAPAQTGFEAAAAAAPAAAPAVDPILVAKQILAVTTIREVGALTAAVPGLTNEAAAALIAAA